MNFLIGNEDEVLPTNIEASTAKLCRIRNADNLTVSTRNNMEHVLQTWSFQSIKDMSKTLESVASSQDSETLYLDILMPVSIIQVNSVFFQIGTCISVMIYFPFIILLTGNVIADILKFCKFKPTLIIQLYIL